MCKRTYKQTHTHTQTHRGVACIKRVLTSASAFSPANWYGRAEEEEQAHLDGEKEEAAEAMRLSGSGRGGRDRLISLILNLHEIFMFDVNLVLNAKNKINV